MRESQEQAYKEEVLAKIARKDYNIYRWSLQLPHLPKRSQERRRMRRAIKEEGTQMMLLTYEYLRL